MPLHIAWASLQHVGKVPLISAPGERENGVETESFLSKLWKSNSIPSTTFYSLGHGTDLSSISGKEQKSLTSSKRPVNITL